MARTYEWSVKQIKKADNSDFTGAIIGTQWKVIGTDDDGVSGHFDGATPFKLEHINPDDYTPYEELTEEVVINWVQGVLNSPANATYWQHIDEVITKEIDVKRNNIKLVPTELLPWSTGSVDYVMPTGSMIPPI